MFYSYFLSFHFILSLFFYSRTQTKKKPYYLVSVIYSSTSTMNYSFQRMKELILLFKLLVLAYVSSFTYPTRLNLVFFAYFFLSCSSIKALEQNERQETSKQVMNGAEDYSLMFKNLINGFIINNGFLIVSASHYYRISDWLDTSGFQFFLSFGRIILGKFLQLNVC